MANIIVTVTDMENSFYYDLEITPGDNTRIVAQKIIEAVSQVNPMAGIEEASRVMDKRTGRILDMRLTVEENCVWNGDYLVFI